MTADRRPSRVLVVSGLQVHPTLSGGNLRSCALASALARRGLDVFVYSFVGRKADYRARRPSAVQAWPGGVAEYVDRGLLGLFAGYGSYGLGLPPLWLTLYLRAAALSRDVLLPRLLREKLEWCDAVVADFPFVHPVFAVSCARGRLRVVSTHNVEHQLHGDRGSWGGRWVRDAVRRVELGAAEAADLVVSCCDADRLYFEANARVRRSIVVPNGIDLLRFRLPVESRESTRAALGLAGDAMVFLFTASKYGPNREAFDYLLGFARDEARLLGDLRIHLLVVGNVVADAVRLPGFTATGKVEVVEPYFAAADAALNPLASGAGTNVKMAEFLAARLPIVTSPFGARGFRIEHGRTGYLFERPELGRVLQDVRRLAAEDPGRLRRIADEAHAENAEAIDMDACVGPLADALAGLGQDAPAAREAREAIEVGGGRRVV